MSRFEEERKRQHIQGTNAAVNIVRSIQDRIPPSNEEIIKVLDSTELALDESKRNPHADEKGKNLIRDSEALVDAARNIIEKKNRDEKFQQLFMETKEAVESSDLTLDNLESIGKEELDKIEALKKKMNNVATYGRVAGEQLIKSSEFRGIVGEALDLIKTIFFQVSDYLADDETEHFSEEDKNVEQEQKMLYRRFKELLKKVSQSDAHHKAVDSVLGLIDHIEVESENIEDKVNHLVKIQLDDHTKKAVSHLKGILEEFMGDKTLDKIFDDLKTLIIMAKDDDDLLRCFRSLKGSFAQALHDPMLLDDDDFTDNIKQHIKDGRNLIKNEDYKKVAQEIVDEWNAISHNIKEDNELKAFNVAFTRMISNLTVTDKDGNSRIDFDALHHVRSLLVPILIEQVKYIPIQSIHGSNRSYNYYLDNIVLSGYEIFPHHIKVRSENDMHISIRDDSPSKSKGKIILLFDNIKTTMKDVRFRYTRKAFPHVSDDGIADIVIGGDGLQIKITLNLEGYGTDFRFVEAEIWTKIDNLTLIVKESNHNLFYRMFRGTLSNLIKSMIEQNIGDKLGSTVAKLRDEMNNALRNISPERFIDSISNRLSDISIL